MTKLKRLSIVTAAVICLSSALPVLPVSAANYESGASAVCGAYSSNSDAFKRAMKIAGVKYDSSLAAKVEKYADRTDGKTISYSKSLTKKFMTKYEKRVNDIKKGDKNAVSKGFVFALADGKNESVIMTAYKNKKVASLIVASGYCDAYFVNSKTSVSADLVGKTKKTEKTTDEEYKIFVEGCFFLPLVEVNDQDKVSVFKFKHKDKSYTFELMYENGVLEGFLYDANGNLAGGYDDNSGFMAARFSLSPEDSLFTPPSYLKERE